MRKLKETVADVEWLVSEWDYDTNSALGFFPDKIGSQSNTYAFWKCKFGHKWKARISNRYHGRGCPECRKQLKTSFPEQAVFFYIKKKFPDAINSFRDLFSNGMEIDVYIPSIRTGIEYDGIAWHKDDTLEKEERKYEICKQNGITLIRLKENVEHYRNDLNIADQIILVRRPFVGKQISYAALDYAIRELLYALLDVDPADLFSHFFRKPVDPSGWEEMAYGPKVKTDVDSRRDRDLIYQNYLVTKENKSLAIQYPEVAALWHPTKNGGLTPAMFSPHTNTRVWWLGNCGHEWDSPITVMTRGCGCPYCHGLRVLKGFNDLETLYPDIAAQWHPAKNGNNKPDMFTSGSGHRAYWLCPVCKQDWQAAINNRTANHRGCPYCAHERPIKGVNDLPTVRPDLMLEWDYDKNIDLDPTDFMISSNKKVWWKCAKCGYEYKTLITNRTKGTGCKQCAGQILIPGVNDLETLYPSIAAEWDLENNPGVLPSQVFPNTNKPYSWICKNGHRWQASPNSRTSGRGCPYCSGNLVWSGFNDLATTHPSIAAEWHPTKNGTLTPTQISKGYNKKVWFLCPTCKNAYDSYIGNKIKGYGKCPFCSPRKTRARFVLQVETGQYFKTLKEAAKSIGTEDIRKIQACCAGRASSAHGYHWKYVDRIASDTV